MSETEREVELIDYIDVVLRRKWLIAVATAACVVGSILYSSRQPVWYSAKALIYVAPSQMSTAEVKATELELPSLSPAFYRSVALADEVQLKLEARRAALQSALGLGSASMAMRVEIVEKTGIELEIRSTEHELPVPLVNAWTDTFMALSEGLSASELGGIYASVQEQFDVARARLTKAEDALAAFDGRNEIVALESEDRARQEQIPKLLSEGFRLRAALASRRTELEEALATARELEVAGTPLHGVLPSELDEVSPERLSVSGRQMLAALRERRDAAESIGALSRRERALLATLPSWKRQRAGSSSDPDQTAPDSLAATAAAALQLWMTYSDSLYAIEAAIQAEPRSVVTTEALVSSEISRRPSEDESGDVVLWLRPNGDVMSGDESQAGMKIVSEAPNPSVLGLQQTRARYRAALLVAEQRLWAALAVLDTIPGDADPSDASSRIHEAMALLAARSGLSKRLLVAQETVDNFRARYEQAVQAADQRKHDVTALTQKVGSLEAQLARLAEQSSGTSERLHRLTLDRERLDRDKQMLSSTYERFAQLVEEARIAAQIASANLRVITRAVTPVAEGVDAGRSAMVAGAVGLILSVFVAFLLEYVRQARSRVHSGGA